MNILFVSIAFLPKNNPECLQAGKYFKYLAKLSVSEIEVLTSSSPTLFMPYDDSLRKLLPDKMNMVELPVPENKYLNFLLRKLNPSLLQLPDSKYLFHLQWERATKKIHKKPDIIYSRSFPLSSTLMAFKLAKHFQVPWVLHLSDPWIDNPLEERTHFAAKKNKEWECQCFKLAKYITLTSEKTVDFYKRKYPEWQSKFILMPNVYDPQDINKESTAIIKGQPLHFVYTGGLTETRSAAPVLKALQHLYVNNPSVAGCLKFSFAGQFDRKNKALFDSFNLPFVYNLGLLSYSDAMKLQKGAHILLAFDSPAASVEQALFFPSKLLDYIASRKRILAITDNNSTTYNSIHAKYGHCLTHNATVEIATVIETYLREYQAGNVSYFNNEIQDEAFSASYNAGRLNELLNEAYAEKKYQ